MSFPGPEFTPIDELAAEHAAVAEIIADPKHEFDQFGADFLLRNLAVASDRLSFWDYDRLSRSTKAKVEDVVAIASEVSPLTPDDMQVNPSESATAYTHRTSIWLPLHKLQAHVHIPKFDENDPEAVNQLRLAVAGSSLAFVGILHETGELPVIAETVSYFRGNTEAARRRALDIVQLSIQKSGQQE